MLFLGLTFFISWGLIAVFYYSVNSPGIYLSSTIRIFYMCIPACVAIFVQKFIYGNSIKNALGISFNFNRWFIFAWLFPPLIAFVTFSISLFLPNVEYDPNMSGMFELLGKTLTSQQIEQMKSQAATLPISPFWLALIQGMVAGITVNTIVALGEELGWRGFLHNEWKIIGFWKSSIMIGIVWGIWHAPLILKGHNYPQHPAIGIFMMIVWCVLISPIFSYIRIRSNSTIATSILHGTLNGTGILAVMMLKGGNDLLIGLTGLVGFLVLFIVNICLLCLTKGRFCRRWSGMLQDVTLDDYGRQFGCDRRCKGKENP